VQFAGKQEIGDAMSKEARPGPGAYPLPASFGPQQQSQKANPAAWKFGTSTRCVPANHALTNSSSFVPTFYAPRVLGGLAKPARARADGDADVTPSSSESDKSERAREREKASVRGEVAGVDGNRLAGVHMELD
jgi:hypothetical protein